MESSCEILPSNKEKDNSIDIEVDSTDKDKEVELKPKVESKDESKDEPKDESKEESKLKMRIEYSQFVRSSTQNSNIKYYTCCRTVLARRPVMPKLIEPDAKIFKRLDDVVPWDETFLPPLPEELTSSQIESIKKGMLLGKMYNMPKSTIKLIFPQLSTVNSDRLTRESGWIKKKHFRCPLCPKDFQKKTAAKNAYNHIEQYHTNSLVTCVKCQLSFTCQDSVLRHKAKEHSHCK